MAIDKVQQDFEKAVKKNINDFLELDKFEDGKMWGSEELTNCYEDTTTEMCFSFFKIGLKSKSREFFEQELTKANGGEEDFTYQGDGYADPYVNLLWKYFNLS